jgi:DNA-binding NarL/FixJ family response regulator
MTMTAKQHEVAALVAEGKRNTEIATQLGVSQYTVAQRLCTLYRKLGVSNRAGVAAWYVRQEVGR